jgi:hypothetical protein
MATTTTRSGGLTKVTDTVTARGGNKGGKPLASKPPAKPKGPNYNAPLYQPTQTLSGKPLAQAAAAIANTQIQPVVSGLRSQIGQNTRNVTGEQRTDFGYFMQLAQAAKDAVAQSTQTNAGLQGTLATNASNLQGQLQNIGQSYQGGALGRMGALGLSGDSLGQLAAQNQQAQGYAAQNATAASNYGAETGANAVQQANALRGATGLAGTEQIGALGRAGAITNQGIQDKISQELAQRGPLTATALGQLRTQERNYDIARQTLANTTLNTGSEIAARKAAAQTQAKNAATAAKNATTSAGQLTEKQLLDAYNTNPSYKGSPAWQRVQSETGKTWSNDPNAVGSLAWYRVQQNLNAQARARGGGGVKPMTHSENNQWFRGLGQVEALARSMQQPLNAVAAKKLGLQQGTRLSQDQIMSYLQGGNNPAGRSFDPIQVDAAWQLIRFGTITPQTAQAMNAMGLRGGTYQGAPIGVKPSGVGRGINRTGAGVGSGGVF